MINSTLTCPTETLFGGAHAETEFLTLESGLGTNHQFCLRRFVARGALSLCPATTVSVGPQQPVTHRAVVRNRNLRMKESSLLQPENGSFASQLVMLTSVVVTDSQPEASERERETNRTAVIRQKWA